MTLGQDLPGQAAGTDPTGLRLLERAVLPDGGGLCQRRPEAAERGLVGALRTPERPPHSHQLRHHGGGQGYRGKGQDDQSCQGKSQYELKLLSCSSALSALLLHQPSLC
jgi:hypothetical protein